MYKRLFFRRTFINIFLLFCSVTFFISIFQTVNASDVNVLSPKEATEIGKKFLEKHMMVGYNGLIIQKYDIKFQSYFSSNESFFVLYEISSFCNKQYKSREVLVEINKTSREIVKVYVSKTNKQNQNYIM